MKSILGSLQSLLRCPRYDCSGEVIHDSCFFDEEGAIMGMIGGLAFLGLVGAIGYAQTGALPPGAKPLVEILEKLEGGPYSSIVDISYDNGYWEVEVQKGKFSYELQIDPRTGEIVAEHRDDDDPVPPKGALALSQVLRRVMEEGYSEFEEVSWENGLWEMEARRAGLKRELRVDPQTGEVLTDRID